MYNQNNFKKTQPLKSREQNYIANQSIDGINSSLDNERPRLHLFGGFAPASSFAQVQSSLRGSHFFHPLPQERSTYLRTFEVSNAFIRNIEKRIQTLFGH